MKKISLICANLICVIFFTTLINAGVTVSNITVAQRLGTKLVDISYDVSSTDFTNVSVDVVISNGLTAVACPNVTGDVGAGVLIGTNKTIVWDAGTDWNGNFSESLRVSVTADDIPRQTYMVIDLSGGMGATNYPVSYLEAAPPGGWTDEYKTDKLVMRKIPAGTFTMGYRSVDYPGAVDFDLHTVTLTKDFYIGVFEVTQKQWELVMGDRPSLFTNATYYATRPVEQVSYYDIRENPANTDDPVVDWPANSAVNATSFMGRLRAKSGLSMFDLPTESQWEYACRAGTTTALNTGYNLTNTTSDAHIDVVGRYWYNGPSTYGYDSSVSTNGATAVIGSYQANGWGLYDMHGNVWEWCLDWHGTCPGNVQDPSGAAYGSERVNRGGSWGYGAHYCRSAFRGGIYPNLRGGNFGFRVARTLP
jgi:formylglycine-generating enzyme required for sulfatase activity